VNNTDSQLFYCYSIDGGNNWSANVAVSNSFSPFVGYPNQDKIGDYITVVSDNASANVAYAATFNGEEDIYYVRVPPTGLSVVEPTPTPTPTTGRASNITRSSAILHGTVNPNGLTTTVHFEYGKTTNYAFTTADWTYTGNTTQSVSVRIPRLRASTKYHFRLVETSNGGISYGSDSTFRTRR
jgi:hypothetical protein